MKDIKVAKLKNSLTVKNVTKVSSSPPILQVTGEKFESATEVLINSISAQQWVATENDTILVYLPASLSTVPITSVAVITEDFVQNIPNLVYFEIGSKIQAVEGIQKLIQNFVKILLQSPGSNKFQSVGGGLLKIAGQTLINGGDKTARTDIIDAVTRTKSYLFSAHSKNPKIPLAEKLLDAQVLSITVGENGKTDLIVSLAIKNRLGEQSSTNVAI
jgi:hypothetical protein